MGARKFPTYGFSGESESRLQQEFEGLATGKLDTSLTTYKSAVPNVTTVPQGKPLLVFSGGVWYIYIRIEDKFWKWPGAMV